MIDRQHAGIVLKSIQQLCIRHNWMLWAAHVRTTHVHVVLSADSQPEPVLNALKAYSSRALNRVEPTRVRWARHGSTKYLWTPDAVGSAVHYVVHRQGEPIAVYENPRSPQI